MQRIKLHKANKLKANIIPLPGSKSESNRVLIINALCDNPGSFDNLAKARDTEIMQSLLNNPHKVYDTHDAGTVMRFMTAYLSVMKENVQIKGSERMHKRPIGILVDALRTLGVNITYLQAEGYPPLAIQGLSSQVTKYLEIDSHVSSQYISSLLMIAPKLPLGLNLTLKRKAVSTPYIDMTVALMHHFGVNIKTEGQTYRLKHQAYHFKPFQVESDWSGASYWYSIFVLSDLPELRMQGLKEQSYQGDSIIAKLMEDFGVNTSFNEGMAILTKTKTALPETIDFINCPDLAQTFAVLCAVLGHSCTFTGLQTLKIKETDRIQAIQTELRKLKADFIDQDDQWHLVPVPPGKLAQIKGVTINTYKDHRMAMAFAALATRMDVIFDDAKVVNKSYPTFWQDMKRLGFDLNFYTA